ncbi:MerR family transcriptional regulator [Bacillus paranthracis]|uniref:MerR family transcriptional regulator n=1 Tax=Bacillus paranthracis TaxID=2026186 RepID=UPI001E58337B|nr:MerR family transcriptional regulator [Bacillus paranthracis]MCC2441668.1 MerR family transcriptional regulator [Bacillus paranthracis]MDG1603157.1 MerR family transcriptional regulator [Bacillus paranthracis]
MLNDKADDMLNEEVAQHEILDFIDMKYGVNQLVTQRTIQRWLDELGIDCIQPRPKRNRDIRYRKSDVLKLEKIKRTNLLRKKNKELTRKDKEKIATDMQQKEIEYNQWLASVTDVDRRQQEIEDMYDYKVPALNKIREDKLEMCFRKLFPDVKFDVEHLEKILFTINEPSMHSDLEYGQAIVDLKEKAYIKNYKD